MKYSDLKIITENLNSRSSRSGKKNFVAKKDLKPLVAIFLQFAKGKHNCTYSKGYAKTLHHIFCFHELTGFTLGDALCSKEINMSDSKNIDSSSDESLSEDSLEILDTVSSKVEETILESPDKISCALCVTRTKGN